MKKISIALLAAVSLLLLASAAIAVPGHGGFKEKCDDRHGCPDNDGCPPEDECPAEDGCQLILDFDIGVCLPETPCLPVLVIDDVPGICGSELSIGLPEVCGPEISPIVFPELCCQNKETCPEDDTCDDDKCKDDKCGDDKCHGDRGKR
jgi:hypothetical protein